MRDLRPLADEIGRTLDEQTQAEELIAFAIARCREVLDAEAVVVSLLDAGTGELHVCHVAGEGEKLPVPLAGSRTPADRGIAGAVLRTGKSARVDDVAGDARHLAAGETQLGRMPRALLCAPLIAPHGVIGVIEAVNLLGAAVFGDDDLAFLDAVALHLAQALEHARGREGGQGGRAGEPEPQAAAPEASPPQGEATVAVAAAVEDAPAAEVFRKEGDYWTVVFDGTLARLKDAKGLHYIAYLLRHPGREFHVTELMALVGDSPQTPHGLGAALRSGQDASPDSAQALRVSDLGDAGTLLDAKAKAEYKHRLDDLRAELEEAERCNDPGRVGRAQEEIEFISEQLTAAVGLGGRDRAAASGAERARLAVTKRIKAAVGRIREAHPVLGRHLADAITTGYFCSYTPRADIPASWSFD